MRTYNFSAGPAALPVEVLTQARHDLLDYQGSGSSIMEQSHRAKHYDAVHTEALDNIRNLLAVPESHAILLLQGGATGQFAMVPMNLLTPGATADYTNSGAWAAKAITEARILGNVHVAADTESDLPTRVPLPGELDLSNHPAYLHITSNETISGAQWRSFPRVDTPLVADMSSDILSRPIDAGSFGVIYAGAQKNLGPAGVTLVIADKALLDRAPDSVPIMFRYATHAKANSLYNTPPTFAVYLLCLVTRWLKDQGGVAAMEKRNESKAAKLYRAIDGTDFYRGTADRAHRSTMNVTFRLADESLEPAFLDEAAARRMDGLTGHRSVGGIRASIYNAFPEEGVDALIDLMEEFEKSRG